MRLIQQPYQLIPTGAKDCIGVDQSSCGERQKSPLGNLLLNRLAEEQTNQEPFK